MFSNNIFSNVILNWPKLLWPFKTVFSPYIDVYVLNCVRNVILHHFRYKEIRLNHLNLCLRTI